MSTKRLDLNHVLACAGNYLIVVGIIHQDRVTRSLIREELFGFGIKRFQFDFLTLLVNFFNGSISLCKIDLGFLGTANVFRVSRLVGKLVHKRLIVVLPQLIQVLAMGFMERARDIRILFAQEILENSPLPRILAFLTPLEERSHLGHLRMATPCPQAHCDLRILKQLLHELVQVRTQNEDFCGGRGLRLEVRLVGNQVPMLLLHVLEKGIVDIQ